MKRRKFLTFLGFGGASTALGAWYWPDEGILNPCFNETTPTRLLQNELISAAWDGVDASQFWDCHTHLIGNGDSDSGIYLHPSMQDLFSPAQYLRYKFYMNASCADNTAGIDESYLLRLSRLLGEFPVGAKSMLLAFDYNYRESGERAVDKSPFHTPNNYAARIAQSLPQRFEWIASIHPYRKDSVEMLTLAVSQGAKAIKWLPPVMGIDPSSEKCDRFYEAMVKHNLPLLTHAGHEHAVAGVEKQSYGNPLLLRRALDYGVRVIVAHCASEGMNHDIDKGKNGAIVPNFDLFVRLMQEGRYENNLFGEISAITQLNRLGKPIDTLVQRSDWHSRLINGSDYPLPGVMPLFSMRQMAERGYITEQQATYLAALRQHNPLLFDFVLKRTLRVNGKQFSPIVFASRRLF